MGASTSVASSKISNTSICNAIMQSITTNSNSSAASTSTSQNANVNLDGSTGGTFSQTADITNVLQSTISTSTDAQLQATSATALTALAKQNTSSSSSVGLNTAVSLSSETQTAITNLSQLITIKNISSCIASVNAEQNLNLSAKNSTGVNVTQGITINNMATCLMSNSSIAAAATTLSTNLAASSDQTTSASLVNTEGLIAVVASCCALCILSSLLYAGYSAVNNSKNAPEETDFDVAPILESLPEKRKLTAEHNEISVRAKKPKANSKSKAELNCPAAGYCVAGIDIGLKNFSICILRQNMIPEPPTIVQWQNKNLYADRVGGKIIKYEAADKLLHRLSIFLDEIGHATNEWKDVNEVAVESQAASTKAIQRVEAFVFAYFYYKHPHIKAKTISASRKLALPGMNHTKEATSTYKGRKNLAIQYVRQFLKSVPEDCPYKHCLDPKPRGGKKQQHNNDNVSGKADDLCDSKLAALYILGTIMPSLTLPISMTCVM